jgi:hypothetical protein
MKKVQVFNPSDNGGLWECPFCDPGASTGVYRLKVPSKTDIEERKHVRLLIKNHVELHQKDLLSQMTDEKNDLQIDRVKIHQGIIIYYKKITTHCII